MITTTALTKSYGKAPVVRDVSLHCEPGTITGFLGPNGAGKSTTLKMIVGLARPDHGSSTNGRPSMVAVPLSGRTRPTIIFSVVDFPAPLAPRKPVMVPGSQRNETSRTTGTFL